MKKFLAIVLAAVMALSMVSFATADGETYDIKIWVAEAAKDLTEKQIADFNANNEFAHHPGKHAMQCDFCHKLKVF